MGDKTGIEWTDATWNPIRGCSRVSEGCRNCYAETVANRFKGDGQPYAGLIAKGGQWNGKIAYIDDLIDQPLRWRRPRRIFVNSMSDLFHENVPVDVIDRVFAVMAIAEHHTFQILTKRPERMRAYLADDRRSEWAWWATNLWGAKDPDAMFDAIHHGDRALPNVWLGVSVEDQKTADERIQILRRTPAAIRWISTEPLLGPIELERGGWALHRQIRGPNGPSLPGLDWVVVGGESGPGARPMNPAWARVLRNECAEGGVQFLFKQWGEFMPADADDCDPGIDPKRLFWSDGIPWSREDGQRGGVALMARVGKKAAGRLLDGVQHDGYPEVVNVSG